MAAGAATESIKLYTGICLLLQHDLVDLACSTATLDVLTNGRFRFGVGVGWNKEELATHRPDLDFSMRYSAMRERIAALRAAWSQDPAEFEGRWDSFEASFIRPKPIHGSIPVSLGNAGPVGIKHAAEYADEWAPIDAGMLNTTGRPNVPWRHRALQAAGLRCRARSRLHPNHDPRWRVPRGSLRVVPRPRRRAHCLVSAPHARHRLRRNNAAPQITWRVHRQVQ